MIFGERCFDGRVIVIPSPINGPWNNEHSANLKVHVHLDKIPALDFTRAIALIIIACCATAVIMMIWSGRQRAPL